MSEPSGPADPTGQGAAAALVAARSALLTGGEDAAGGGAARGPAELRAALTELYEGWLRERAGEAGIDADSGFALVAFGGLGRRDLVPGSDLDLLLVHDGASATRLEEIAERLWYPLWDTKVGLDQSARTVAETLSVAAGDLTVALSLLDARVVAGDADLGALVVDGALRQWRNQIPRRFGDLVELTETRRRRAGLIANRMEPDLKNGAGGLRDVQLVHALAAAHLTDRVPEPLPGTPGAGLAHAERTLLDARTELHRVTGRARDVLNAQYGDDVADRLGMSDRFELARLLSDAARTIAHGTDLALQTAAGAVPKRGLSGLLSRSPVRRPLAEGVVEQGGQVVLARGVRVDRDPGVVLRLGAAAARHGLPIAPATLRLLAEQAPAPAEPWTPETVGDLVTLLGSGEAQVPIVEALDRSGLWGRLLPEWDHVRDLPARDQAHVYTVDRHLVQTAVEASELATEVGRVDLLLVAAILHDLGKGRDEDHSVVGARLARWIGTRMGLPEADGRTLERVVLHHLLLAVTAGRADPEDPATADAVLASLDHDPVALEILGALTVADSRATGPSVWTDWRGRVHAALVATCRRRLAETTPGDSTPPVLPAELDDPELRRRLLDLIPGGRRHVVHAALPGGVGDLALLAGVLSAHGLDVETADARLDPDVPGLRAALVVATPFGSPPDPGLVRQDLRRGLGRGLPEDLRRSLRRRRTAAQGPARAEPHVSLRPRREPATGQGSATAGGAADAPTAELVVRSEDRPGLLADVLHALERVGGPGVEIAWLRVRTWGAGVDDTLALAGPGARDPETGERIRNAVAEVLPTRPDRADARERPIR